MLNGIWLGLIVMAVFLGGVTGRLDVVTQQGFSACTNAVMGLALPLAGVMCLWLGVMRLAERAGAVAALARWMRPVLCRIFPDVPPMHPAMGSIVMNMAANMLGLANAATPLGLRAMRDLERLNGRPGTATNAMCTFLALNTSSVQLIPATAVAILASKGAVLPTAIIGTSLVATTCSTIAGLVAVKIFERLPFYRLPEVGKGGGEVRAVEEGVGEEARLVSGQGEGGGGLAKVGLGWCLALGTVALVFLGLFVMMAFFPEEFGRLTALVMEGLGLNEVGGVGGAGDGKGAERMGVVGSLSVLAIPFFLVMFPMWAAARGVKVYEEFVEGAREGFEVAVRIIPYLVAILAAVGMFRAAGGVDLLARLLAPLLQPLGCPAELLPLILMRPLSGSGSTGLFAELVGVHGPDSLVARMAGTVLGSTETTFYVIAVYFGSVGVRRTRHAVPAGLVADAAGVVAAVMVSRLVFGEG